MKEKCTIPQTICNKKILIELLKITSVLESIEEYLYADGPNSLDKIDYSIAYSSFIALQQTLEKFIEQETGE